MTIQNQCPAFHTDVIRSDLANPRSYLTDGGFETTMLFPEGFDLTAFAACVQLEDDVAGAAMDRYFGRFLATDETAGTGFVLDTNTWRSGTHWADAVGRSPARMQDLTREAVRFALAIRDRWQDRVSPILLNGVFGSAGDAHDGTLALDATAAEAIRAPQIASLATCGVDLVSALKGERCLNDPIPCSAMSDLSSTQSRPIPSSDTGFCRRDYRSPPPTA